MRSRRPLVCGGISVPFGNTAKSATVANGPYHEQCLRGDPLPPKWVYLLGLLGPLGGTAS